MKYRGYQARYEVDEEAGTLVGRVDGIRDVVTFEAETVRQLEEEFHSSVDEYIAYCEEQGDTPEKPYNGKFLIRTSPSQHADVAKQARAAGVSVNQWLVRAIDKALERTPEVHPAAAAAHGPISSDLRFPGPTGSRKPITKARKRRPPAHG